MKGRTVSLLLNRQNSSPAHRIDEQGIFDGNLFHIQIKLLRAPGLADTIVSIGKYMAEPQNVHPFMSCLNDNVP